MLLTLAILAAASVRLEPTVPLHHPASSSWIREERPPPSHSLTLTLALRLDREALERLEALFWAVSTPGHPKYGQHINNPQVTACKPIA
eukprot:scaffold315253_cov31-Tisochrysis_lutea.AAC.4